MARATIKFGRPITQIELDLDEESLEAVGFIRIVKCSECIHRYDPKRQMCTGRKPDFFCADGEKKTEGTEFFTEGHLHLGNIEEE